MMDNSSCTTTSPTEKTSSAQRPLVHFVLNNDDKGKSHQNLDYCPIDTSDDQHSCATESSVPPSVALSPIVNDPPTQDTLTSNFGSSVQLDETITTESPTPYPYSHSDSFSVWGNHSSCGDNGGKKSKIAKLMRYLFSTNLLHYTHGKPHEQLNWFEKLQKWLAELLEGHWAQAFVIALLLLDVLITSVELLLEHSDPTHKNKALKIVHKVLFSIALAIMSVFVIEITLKIFAFGWRFFTKILFVFDAIVIVTSLVLEIVYGMKKDVVAGLLLALRLWRVIRIVYSVLYSAQLHHDERMAKMKEKYLCRVKEQNDEISQVNAMLQSQNTHMRQVGMALRDLEDQRDWNDPAERRRKEQLVKIHVLLF